MQIVSDLDLDKFHFGTLLFVITKRDNNLCTIQKKDQI